MQKNLTQIASENDTLRTYPHLPLGLECVRPSSGVSTGVRIKGHDRWKRAIGEVVLPDGRVLNHELVRAGFAWWFRKYAISETTVQPSRNSAAVSLLGLIALPLCYPLVAFRHLRRDACGCSDCGLGRVRQRRHSDTKMILSQPHSPFLLSVFAAGQAG
jgi:hypothetical protein